MALESFRTRHRSVIRRKDRRLDEPEWQSRMLELAPLGHLAIAVDGIPFIHSNIFWYDGEAIYLHQARVGRLRSLFEGERIPATFTVSEMGRILPDYTPLEFSVEYASVVTYGTIEVVDDLAQQQYALEGLMEKYAPQLTAGEDYDPMPESDIRQTTVHRIAIDEITGKHNVKPEDFHPYRIGPYKLPVVSFIDLERESGRVTVQPKTVE